MRTDEGAQQNLESRQEVAEYLRWVALSSIDEYNRYIEYTEGKDDGHE